MTDYVTLNDYKAYVGIDDTDDDPKMEDAITAASRNIDDFCGVRPSTFAPAATATTRSFAPDDGYVVRGFAISTLTDLAVTTDDTDTGLYGTTWATTDYQVEPYDALVDGYPITALRAISSRWWPTTTRRPGIQITARWGWPETPAPVRQACLIITQDLFRMKDVVFGAETTTITEFGPLRVSASIGRNAATLLSPYINMAKLLA